MGGKLNNGEKVNTGETEYWRKAKVGKTKNLNTGVKAITGEKVNTGEKSPDQARADHMAIKYVIRAETRLRRGN